MLFPFFHLWQLLELAWPLHIPAVPTILIVSQLTLSTHLSPALSLLVPISLRPDRVNLDRSGQRG